MKIQFKKFTLLLAILLAWSTISFPQNVEENIEVRNLLNNMFANLDKSKVPHGLLRDYAFELVDMNLYSGATLTESNYVDRETFDYLLRTISSAAVGAKPFADVRNILTNQYNAGKDGVASIAAMGYQYAFIKENALTDGLIKYQNDKVYDNFKNGVWQNPYDTKYVFGFCLDKTTYPQSQLTFKFPTDCWVSNLQYNSLSIDLGDGKGYRKISVGENVSTTYYSSGNKDIKLKIALINGKELIAHSKIFIYPPKTRNSSDSGVFFGTFQGDPYKGVSTKADVHVKYASSTSSIHKPLIIVEGFDPRQLTETKKYGHTSHENILRNLSQTSLGRDYDIFYVDWQNSEEYIQANAKTLEKIINRINSDKHSTGSTEPNVILGQSMGGLVVRYALKDMELRNIPHDCSIYISHDAPHLGANIPLGALYAVHGALSFYENKGDGLASYIPDGTGTKADLLKSILYCKSAKQMLVNYVNEAGELDNSFHIQWQNEINQMGLPQGDKGKSFRALAISNGDYTPISDLTYFLKADFFGSTGGIVDVVTGLFPGGVAAFVGTTLYDWRAALLSMLPGKSTLFGNININPAITPGKKICDMEINYEKKFLWMIPIERTIFSYKKKFAGGLTYDIFPGSYYKQEFPMDTFVYNNYNNVYIPKTIILLAKYGAHVEMATKFQFIPTASSLYIGGGKQHLTNALFTTKYDYQNPNTPFGNNVYINFTNSSLHISFSKPMIDWIENQLYLAIDGPKLGLNNSQFTVKNAITPIKWSTSDPNIATISSDGKLTVKGNGIVEIRAEVNNTNISRKIMTGFPRFVLGKVEREPGYYGVTAKCIDLQYIDFIEGNKDVIAYEWGVKKEGQPLTWTRTDTPEYREPDLDNDENVTIYMRTIDYYGNAGNTIFVKVTGADAYDLNLKGIIFNKHRKMYSLEGRPLNSRFATLILKLRKTEYEYNGMKWRPTKLMVLNDKYFHYYVPFKANNNLLKDIFPSKEMDYILSFPNNKVVLYKFSFYNVHDAMIQTTPFTIIYRENFPN